MSNGQQFAAKTTLKGQQAPGTVQPDWALLKIRNPANAGFHVNGDKACIRPRQW